MPSEISNKADFSKIRYAQCWEDADILLSALNIQSSDVCLSIASAGDNTLAMLSQSPARVIAVDINPAQIACLELRVAAYRELTHPELLVLIGSSPGDGAYRISLYHRCRSQLSVVTRQFWDEHTTTITQGIGTAGKFERYLSLFRLILPLIHNQDIISKATTNKTQIERHIFYQTHWNNRRWQFIFKIFFSQFILGRFGRDPSFFDYAQKNVAEHLLQRTAYAMTKINPYNNPYLQWIATGKHLTALPYALRPENFEIIRANLDRLEWHCTSIEDLLSNLDCDFINKYNLSNIFEYMSYQNYENLLKKLVRVGKTSARLAYWNLLAKRSRPENMKNLLYSHNEEATELYQQDKAFFYSAFILEEII
jgi:S-adenosylmethionine-diacylglycerol 3-amino-3-carboxypropyl transferase